MQCNTLQPAAWQLVQEDRVALTQLQGAAIGRILAEHKQKYCGSLMGDAIAASSTAVAQQTGSNVSNYKKCSRSPSHERKRERKERNKRKITSLGVITGASRPGGSPSLLLMTLLFSQIGSVHRPAEL